MEGFAFLLELHEQISQTLPLKQNPQVLFNPGINFQTYIPQIELLL